MPKFQQVEAAEAHKRIVHPRSNETQEWTEFVGQMEPDKFYEILPEGQPLRTLKVRFTRAANTLGRPGKHAETVDSTLMVWVRGTEARGKSGRGSRREAAALAANATPEPAAATK